MENIKSTWQEESPRRTYPSLSQDIQSDVVVIGGGLLGLLSAYLLREQGFSVVVIEKNSFGEGATGLTTAFLTQSIDTEYRTLREKLSGAEARLIAESHGRAIDLLETIVEKESIECELIRCTNTIIARDEKEAHDLKEESEEMERAGIRLLFSRESNLPFDITALAHLENQAKLHPLKFLRGLLRKLEERGVKLFEKTEAIRIENGTIDTLRGKVTAKWIIVATYEPLNQPIGLFFKKGMYTSYVQEIEIPHGVIPENIYEDLANPYHYFRIDPLGNGKDRMIVGGEDHREDIPVNPEKSFAALTRFTQEILGGIPHKHKRRWRGPILEPSDGLAFIGPYKNERTLYGFGFSGNGMTYSGIGAELFRDYIMGQKNPYAEIYRTDRFAHPGLLLQKAGDYLGEFLGGAVKNSFKKPRKNGSSE